jgi:hypothetical protein
MSAMLNPGSAEIGIAHSDKPAVLPMRKPTIGPPMADIRGLYREAACYAYDPALGGTGIWNTGATFVFGRLWRVVCCIFALALLVAPLEKAAAQDVSGQDKATLEAQKEALFQQMFRDPANLDVTFAYADVSARLGDYPICRGFSSNSERSIIAWAPMNSPGIISTRPPRRIRRPRFARASTNIWRTSKRANRGIICQDTFSLVASIKPTPTSPARR